VKIYPRILINTLPLIVVGFLVVGGLAYSISASAMANLAEQWLDTKLGDATRVAGEDVELLRKYGLESIEANVVKAKAHTGKALNKISIGRSGYLWVVDATGTIVVHPEPDRIGERIADQAWYQAMNGRLKGKCFHYSDDEKYLAVYKYFPSWSWYIVASAPQSELYGRAYQMRTYLLGGSLAALIITAMVLMVLARRLTAPLDALAKEAELIGQGDHNGVVADLARKDEIGTLSTAFNRMTHQLSRRIVQEQLVSGISRRFIHLSAEKIDEAIQAALKQIGEYTGADRCYVGELSLDAGLVGHTHEWCGPGVASQATVMEGFSLKEIPWFTRQMTSDGYVLAPEVKHMPSEAEAEKKIWQSRGIQSVVRVPMTYGGELRGFVGLDAIDQPRPWSRQDVQLMIRVGELFCNTLERRWYQETLAAEKERLTITLQSIGDGVITTDVESRVVLINRVGELYTGWLRDDAVGQPIDDLFTLLSEETRQPLFNPIINIIYTGQTAKIPSQSILLAKDGTERLVAVSVAPIYEKENKIVGVVLVFRDVTEKRRMEQEMLKVEKLESIGVLAGGIAHDFNNILTAIIGNISLAKHYADNNGMVRAKMDEIEKASFRARDLTQQLLTFSKGGEPIKKTVVFARLFYDSAMFALGGSNVRLAYTPPDNLWAVEADEGQLGQVVNNLIINAVQAMPKGGVIHAQMDNVELPPAAVLPLCAGSYVKLTIKDQGAGISQANLRRIFDPFFTTKQGGSGLGLATAYAIIEKHGGYITVDSREGHGTAFALYLPASDQVVREIAPAPHTVGAGIGKVLLMDDEQIIREVAGEILSTVGYSVDFAKDGQEMLDLYSHARNKGDGFDVVIMDLTIPGGMGGKEAIERLLKIDPAAKAIVSSGYSTDPVMSNHAQYGFRAAVTKPYKLEDICSVINDVLSGSIDS
jgi:PAS domain S-box-containing protein